LKPKCNPLTGRTNKQLSGGTGGTNKQLSGRRKAAMRKEEMMMEEKEERERKFSLPAKH